MGSGSSRSGRALRRLRSPDSRPEAGEAAAAEAVEGAAGPGPAAPPDGGDETLRLLDQLLAESAAWGPGELAPRGPARPRPAVSPKWSTEDHPESSSVSEAPGSCHRRPERQSAITYDYSEEELMASIEQEYCC
ncbi:PREDICTED: cystin-1 [Lipotes vexillifer]|uniref:Cystin-1 n=1 Tax=Lipotes vexillifer TaxID=118797 RepID=A0A340X612_LIPVE|nr:PREDICTED: cystin-1 [Lipotes vexillifer]